MDLLGYGAFFLTTALIFSLVTLGLNLQWGLTGLFNVGVAGFVAIGAYTSALLTTPDDAARLGGFGLPIGGRATVLRWRKRRYRCKAVPGRSPRPIRAAASSARD